jgi:hypothetical protein
VPVMKNRDAFALRSDTRQPADMSRAEAIAG